MLARNALRRLARPTLQPAIRGAAVRTYLTVGEYMTRDQVGHALDRYHAEVSAIINYSYYDSIIVRKLAIL